MEYSIGEYIRSKEKVYTSSDGYKYFSSKAVGRKIYLRCTLFRNSCTGTANPFIIIRWKITNPEYMH